MLPPHLERIREKLAENIHELWAVTRIEQGWTYAPVSVDSGLENRCSSQQQIGRWNLFKTTMKIIVLVHFQFMVAIHLPSQFRDDNKKLHPCLVDFQSLPEPERNYNLQMSGETLKYVCGGWGSARASHACQRRDFNAVDTVADPRLCALQDSPGARLPCWYG